MICCSEFFNRDVALDRGDGRDAERVAAGRDVHNGSREREMPAVPDIDVDDARELQREHDEVHSDGDGDGDERDFQVLRKYEEKRQRISVWRGSMVQRISAIAAPDFRTVRFHANKKGPACCEPFCLNPWIA